MSSKVRLGGFILAALVAFGVMVFLLGDKQFLFSSTYDINTQFENVARLDQGAPVRAGEASNSLKSITGKIDSGQGTIGGLVNDRALYQNLNTTVAQAKEGVTSFQEDMEALKHNFLLRGFFNKRGYFDSSELTKHAIARLPRGKPVKQFAFDEKDLFAKPDTAKLSKAKVLDEVGAFLQSGNFGLAVIQAETGPTGEKANEISEARAMVVRQYLADKFKVDDTRVKTMGLGKGEGSGRVTILVYGGGSARPTVEARNK